MRIFQDIIDLLRNKHAGIEDFYNGDHLNIQGAEKLTKLIRTEISKNT